MKSDYIFAYHMTICRPASGVFLAWNLERIVGLGEVVDQGVKPNIDSLGRVVRYWNTPTQSFRRARDRKILQSIPDFILNVLQPYLWDNFVVTRRVVLLKPFLESRQAEMVIVL